MLRKAPAVGAGRCTLPAGKKNGKRLRVQIQDIFSNT
jgi:hypothetical protein